MGVTRGVLGLLLTLFSPLAVGLPRFRVRPAEVRRYRELREPLRLDLPYYLARGSRGPVLIPKDRYLEEVEALLEAVGREP